MKQQNEQTKHLINSLFYLVIPVFLLLIIPIPLVIVYIVYEQFLVFIISFYLLSMIVLITFSFQSKVLAFNYIRMMTILLFLSYLPWLFLCLCLWIKLFPLFISILFCVLTIWANIYYIIMKNKRSSLTNIIKELESKNIINIYEATYNVENSRKYGMSYKNESNNDNFISRLLSNFFYYIAPITLGISFAFGRLGLNNARLTIILLLSYSLVFGFIYIGVHSFKMMIAVRKLEAKINQRIVLY